MSIPTSPAPSGRAAAANVILLLLPQFAILDLFGRHALAERVVELRGLALAVALLTLLTLAALWWRRPWALWAVLVVVSMQATIDLSALARHVEEAAAVASLILLVATTLLTFRHGVPASAGVGVYQRVLFGLVLTFAAWVAVWGLFLPGRIGIALPIAVAPLHARFLGAMYLSGATFMLLGMLARAWSDVRVVTVILAWWTGMLGIVSALHLDTFDWSRWPTWFWFFAYVCFPLVALWVTWCQRRQSESDSGPRLSGPLRRYLQIQGGCALALAACLLVAPTFMTARWPWPIPVLVAQIYGAPFLAYGVGSLCAARQQTWREARSAVYGTLVFALGVLAASILHASLFNPRTPSAWLWFGGFAAASLALLLFSIFPSLRVGDRVGQA